MQFKGVVVNASAHALKHASQRCNSVSIGREGLTERVPYGARIGERGWTMGAFQLTHNLTPRNAN